MFLCLCYSHRVLGQMSDMYSLATSPASDCLCDVNLHGNELSHLRETRLVAGIWFCVEWCSDDKMHLVSQTLDSVSHHSLTTLLSVCWKTCKLFWRNICYQFKQCYNIVNIAESPDLAERCWRCQSSLWRDVSMCVPLNKHAGSDQSSVRYCR